MVRENINTKQEVNSMGELMKIEPIQQQVALSGQFDKSQVELLKTTICKGASDDELKFFISVCQKTGLDPFSRQIYSIPRGGQRTIQVSVDGLRAIADKSGRYAPGRPTEYKKDDSGSLESATAYVKKQTDDGTWHEIGVTAFLSEYNAKNNIWKQYTYQMLSKCAECLALRKAFPVQLSGLYGQEEMGNAREDTSNVKPLYTEQAKPIISTEQAIELANILKDTSPSCQARFNEYLKNSLKIDILDEILEENFEKIKKNLIKERDHYQKGLAEKEMQNVEVKE